MLAQQFYYIRVMLDLGHAARETRGHQDREHGKSAFHIAATLPQEV